jgi:ketosteroid isomerase-like protein
MSCHTLSFAVAALLIPALAGAHVGVRPRESKPGAEERYTVRVPTEGALSTTSAELEIPDGVTVVDVPSPEGATHEVKRAGGRIVAIVWTKEIKAKESAEFIFVARNPPAGADIVWKAHQHFADGTAAHWIEPAGSKRPASVTRLSNAPAATAASAGNNTMQTAPPGEAAAIDKWLAGYDAAFLSKDLDKLAVFYHPDVTIYEGGGINNGWADYRDRHLGPELRAFEGLEFGHSDRKVNVASDGRSAYATSRYFIRAKLGERALDSVGLETLVLMKQPDGAWKIRHSHTSSRARRPTDK